MATLGYTNNSNLDMDICDMFGSLSLTGLPEQHGSQIMQGPPTVLLRDAQAVDVARSHSSDSDTSMIVELTDREGNVQFISSPPPKAEELGCGLLHLLRRFYNPPVSQETCCPPDPDFNFLDTILTHREAFVAYPYGHRSCSQALTKLATSLEHKHQETHADGDLDTAIALHNEAWLMSGWYSK